MDRLGAVNDILAAVGDAMDHKRLELRDAATAAALSAANSTERITALIESLRMADPKNNTFGIAHSAAEALHDVLNFDVRASLAASGEKAAQKAQQFTEAAETEWQKVKVKTAAAAEHMREQVEESRERMRELASFRQLSEHLWRLQNRTLGDSTIELRIAANHQISSVMCRFCASLCIAVPCSDMMLLLLLCRVACVADIIIRSSSSR